ncbi:unnamed protein product [Alopecurus aequalis]
MEEISTKIADAILCAIMGEVANRSISFLAGKWRNKQMSPTEEQRLESLRRVLLRVRAVVEEAEGRHITNVAMLEQLNTLRMEMHGGYYVLDRFSCGAPDNEGDKVSRSFALQSNFSSAKRLRAGGSAGESAHELQRVLARIEAAVEDAGPEFARLAGRHPRLFRQPYSAYLLLDRCMFGRQMEMEHVVNFLLQSDVGQARQLGVLPIVGPGKVGKSTLVHHACADDRVRGQFSRIAFFRATADDDLTAVERAITLAPDGVADQRVLIIVELDGDFQEVGPWRKLCSSVSESRHVGCGSKMIVTSRSDKIASLGTTLPLKLSFFTPEAYWYFFKVRTFGSADAAEHPKLASIAMEIARELNGCFIAANIFRGILKSSVDARSWSLALATLREFWQNNLSLFSAARPVHSWDSTQGPVKVQTTSKSTSPGRYGFVILDNYETPSFQSDAEAPAVTVQDVLYGGARLQGKFDVLASRSHLPPHFYYVFNCEVRTPQRVVSKKKKNHRISAGS